jgi:hypothetical protein
MFVIVGEICQQNLTLERCFSPWCLTKYFLRKKGLVPPIFAAITNPTTGTRWVGRAKDVFFDIVVYWKGCSGGGLCCLDISDGVICGCFGWSIGLWPV